MPPKEQQFGSHSVHRGGLASIARIPRRGLAMALLVRVVLFSSVITLILTVLQLTLSYRSERSSLESRFDEIDQATSRSLGESLWAMDSKQLEEQLDGILRLPSIRAVGVREVRSSGDTFIIFRGERQTSNAIVKEYPLVCCGARPQQIGVLHIEATLAEIYRDVAAQALVILFSNAAKTFLVAFFILFAVHHLATRHLRDIAGSVGGIRPDADLAPLRLRRSRIEGDELDQLVDALNTMRERLRRHAVELGNANARMAAILDNIPDLAWVKDTQGRFIAVNRAIAASKGFAGPEEMIGKTDFDFSPPELARTYLRDDAEVMASHVSKRIEEQHINADGSTTWIETIKTALHDGTGRVAGTVGVARDLSERKRAEEEARESERRYREVQMDLAHANRVATMGQLAASIAHEVNQPIAATVTNAQAALRWLSVQPPDVEEVREVLCRIVSDGNRAGSVVRRIRELIKKAPPRKEPFDINEAIREVIALTRGEAMKNGASVQTQLADGLPFAECDRVELQQVVLNLIMNAIEAMSGVSDGARDLLISTGNADPGWVLVAVRDSGPGVAPDTTEHVFAPFYTTKSTGLGMGLAICRSIIEAHGGRLWASANQPCGAAFQFTVPTRSDV
ncbi:Adaptive-response sensory-kinase SasA [Paraburkholderia ultramafica]|uniref:histidine kinase n=1 Tax=Paraburkholderia ultramafica TaxID=1544867 RepID=A0A6S7BPX3_9BURK|nr:Adaptive-response sensory-kinase SasA [Paraburkholderia ultramafica]